MPIVNTLGSPAHAVDTNSDAKQTQTTPTELKRKQLIYRPCGVICIVEIERGRHHNPMNAIKQTRKVVRYRGDVQGVGFRANAIHQGRGLKIKGFVRNEPDGDVLLDVQGPTNDLKELLRRIGSSMERKINETLIDEREPLPDREKFSIRY